MLGLILLPGGGLILLLLFLLLLLLLQGDDPRAFVAIEEIVGSLRHETCERQCSIYLSVIVSRTGNYEEHGDDGMAKQKLVPPKERESTSHARTNTHACNAQPPGKHSMHGTRSSHAQPQIQS